MMVREGYLCFLLFAFFILSESNISCNGILRKNPRQMKEIMKGLFRPVVNKTHGASKVFRDLKKYNIEKNSSGCYNWKCKSEARQGEDCVWCLPSIFVAGVSKCGTTAICRKLASHPDVKPYRKKEINIFTKFSNYSWATFERRIVDTHPDSHARNWIDCSSGAFRDMNVAALLAKYSRKTKIIFMVRDPWQRLGSLLAMLRRNNDQKTYREMVQSMLEKYKTHAWSDAVRVHPRGVFHFAKVNDFFYAEIIMNWMTVTPRSRMMPVDQYNLEFFPNETMRQIENFLKLPNHNYDQKTLLRVSKNTVNVKANEHRAQEDIDVRGSDSLVTETRVDNMKKGQSTQIHKPYSFDENKSLKKFTIKLFRPSLCLFRNLFKWDIKIITENIL